MNRKALDFIKNFSYTLTSNLISIVISTIVTLVVPKLIGVQEYGYWQLYLFYSSYVIFLIFGWNDGIYLRYGGKEYKDLDKGLFFSQFSMQVISQIIMVFIVYFLSNIFVSDGNKLFIFEMTALCMLIVNVRYMLMYVLQATNRIREYAWITMADRIFYLCLIVFLLLAGVREYKLMIIADLAGKLISLFIGMYYCRDMVFRKITTFYFSFKEAYENISVGVKLMFANISSMLVVGVVRFGIERSWDVSTFGRVSLTLSISNFLMTFIGAVGLVMFPILRRTDENKLPAIYSTLRDFLMVLLLGILIIYYPFKAVISAWLPNYAKSLKYMAILFPMCVFEGKMSLLINTYLKTLRKEKQILRVNLATLCFSVLMTYITTYLLKNLDLTVVSIVVILAFRCIIAELYLSNALHISVYKDVVLELIMTAVFITSGWYINSWMTMLIYGGAYLIYLFIKRKDIKNTGKNIRALVKS